MNPHFISSIFNDVGNSIFSNDEHSVTDNEMMISFNDWHFLNENFLIFFNDFGSEIVDNDEHSLNDDSSISVIDSGIEILVNDVNLLKIENAILVRECQKCKYDSPIQINWVIC